MSTYIPTSNGAPKDVSKEPLKGVPKDTPSMSTKPAASDKADGAESAKKLHEKSGKDSGACASMAPDSTKKY